MDFIYSNDVPICYCFNSIVRVISLEPVFHRVIVVQLSYSNCFDFVKVHHGNFCVLLVANDQLDANEMCECWAPLFQKKTVHVLLRVV